MLRAGGAAWEGLFDLYGPPRRIWAQSREWRRGSASGEGDGEYSYSSKWGSKWGKGWWVGRN
jgi:hypothetical protein